ncbi:hypothetical protein JTE90_003153 [Oedothorax gibbosus]|uniref:Uncharacterized protein n=1 Tax=Oedothorax gibbosus TaxID=931172 RepID=A0AAV6UBJ2_9ARAC|nr:hypothetical protein JTE90_003153 [Oedothorax gibbosus]
MKNLKVQLHICHTCKCPANCENVPHSNEYVPDTGPSYDMFDLLAQNMPPQKFRKQKLNVGNATPATYRNDYCRNKRKLPPPPELYLPFHSLFIPEGKMCCKTTHKTDFRPYKEKEIKSSEIRTHRDNIVCSKLKFQGKSESKSAYTKKRTVVQNESEVRRRKQNKENIKIPDLKMESSTTYKSAYKRPKNFLKTEILKPKNPRQILPPLENSTQYKCDFKKPKKVENENFKKTSVFHPPTVPMENKTTYKKDFNNKNPPSKTSRKRSTDEQDSSKTDKENCCCQCLNITLKGCFDHKETN